jgi:hypothetical protein
MSDDLVWSWYARDKAQKKKPITVEAVTYAGALIVAARRLGFVSKRWPTGEEEVDITRVEVRVVREYEMQGERAA